jgi:hypothetical protein
MRILLEAMLLLGVVPDGWAKRTDIGIVLTASEAPNAPGAPCPKTVQAAAAANARPLEWQAPAARRRPALELRLP